MFAKATRNFLRDIDAGGDLISVASLNDADKVNLLSVVAKKKRFWCWQKPKYHFSSLTCMLSDVLTEEKPVKPVVVESEFVKYEGVWGDVIQGNMDADVGTLHMNAAGVGYVESQSSFGDLRKQEVDMQLLMKDVQERAINLDHPFIQQLHERKNDVLCILKEKIVTTQKCVIAEHTQTGEKYGGKIGIKAKMVKVSVSENGNFIKDENTVLEIPPPTAIAYGVVELYVKRDGHFEFCLLPEKQGGFEKETAERNRHPAPRLYDTPSVYHWDVVDGVGHMSVDRKVVPSNVSLCFLKQDILELKKHFSAWEKLPEVQRLHLYELLCEILFDGQTVAQLQNVLEEICSAHKPHLTVLDELKPPQKRRAQDILHLIGYHMENEKLLDQKHQAITDLLVALHFLTSALDEMSDSCLAILGTCCELQLLPGLCALPNIASDEGLCSRTDPSLSDFIDQGRFQIVQRLFSSSNMNLEMNEHTLKAATTKEPGFLPHILYIAISGFHALKNLKM
ncbi:gasdermin-E [Ascaphus truei]|uniref:gasdermin-E n=1 Tax=Ascaphus truei TaxID=8439 RepID=UPI003F59FCDD